MDNNIKIRTATMSDIPKMQELRKTGWQDNYVYLQGGVTKKLLKDKLAKMPPSKEDIEFNTNLLKNPKSKNYNLVAELNGNVIGVVFYNILENGNGDIGVFVERGYRGKGTGSKLLDNLVKNTNNTLEVSVFSENQSIKLYKKFGFKEVGKVYKLFFDQNIYLPVQKLLLER